MKNPMLSVLWLASAGALALAVYNFPRKEWLAGVFLALIGLSAIAVTVAMLRVLSQVNIPIEAAGADSGGRIVMGVSQAEMGDTLLRALGFLLTAVGLVQFPDALWTKSLSYPAACLALVLYSVMILVTMGQKLERVVADTQGIEVSRGGRACRCKTTG